MKLSLFVIVFVLSTSSAASCQVQDSLCNKFIIHDEGNPDSKFGEIYYEKFGGRFVYLVKMEAGAEYNPYKYEAKLVYGYDGNEKWIASFLPHHIDDPFLSKTATLVARYSTDSKLDEGFPEDKRMYFTGVGKTGRDIWNKVAIFESIQNAYKPSTEPKSREDFLKIAKEFSNVKVNEPNSFQYPVRRGSEFYDYDYLNLEISTKGLSAQTWDFIVQVDDSKGSPIRKVLSQYAHLPPPSGGSNPTFPFPTSFEITRSKEVKVSPIIFFPQHYSGSNTKLITFD